MNWQGLNQDPAGYQNVTGYQDDPVYPKNGPSYADAVEDDQMHGMADSLATLRPEPEPDEQMIAPETMIPGHMSYEGVQYPITVSVALRITALARHIRPTSALGLNVYLSTRSTT